MGLHGCTARVPPVALRCDIVGEIIRLRLAIMKTLIAQMRSDYDGWNSKPAFSELVEFRRLIGALPVDVLSLYQDHDGSPALPRRGDAFLPVRLLPMREALDVQRWLAERTARLADVGRIVWLWTDDNSNYAGIYTTGMLEGWLVKLNHDEPVLTPAYRSVASFLKHVLESAPGKRPDDDAAFDLVMVPRDIPCVDDNQRFVDADRAHARAFAEMHSQQSDADMRRLYAQCAICLTPVADTGTIVPFLREDDMWTPELAIQLFELRRFGGALDEVDRLAREGGPNGDSAAMRLLVRLRSDQTRAIISRLQRELSGQKLDTLRQWVDWAGRLQPPTFR